MKTKSVGKFFSFFIIFILFLNTWKINSVESHSIEFTPNSTSSFITYPNFKWPWGSSENGQVLWTGGPHAWANNDTASWISASKGSGLDFAKGGLSFDVTAMASGVVIANRCGTSLGCIVAIRHNIGGTVMVYGHLQSDANGIEPLNDIQVDMPVVQETIIGHAGETNTDNIHLHLEFRDGASCNVGSPYCSNDIAFAGNPIGWDGNKLVDNYYISGYYDSDIYCAPGADCDTIFNYDGSAVSGALMAPFINFPYYDDGTPREVLAFVHPTFTCNSTTNCEIDAADKTTVFAAHGDFTGGGGIIFSTSHPINPPSPPPTTTDTTLPTGSFTSPSNGASITTRTLTVSANASDNSGGSGVGQVLFSAKWSGIWHIIGVDSSSPYSTQIDMCNNGVPNGDVELGLEVWDNAGNHFIYSDNLANPHVNFSYDCSTSGLPSVNQWHAEAWMNKYLAGLVNYDEYWPAGVTNVTYPFIGFEKDWGTGAPYSGFPSDEFSFKIYSNLHFNGGIYNFRVCSDDGVVFEIDGQKLFDEWWDRGGCLQTSRALDNKYHTLEVRYYENTGNAYIKLYIWGEEYPRPELDEPEGKITSPSNNSYSNKNPLTIYADAWDDVSGVDRVKFKVYHCYGGCQWRDISTDSTFPYSASLDTTNLNGQQIKLAIDVTDNSGKTRTTADGEVLVTIDRSAPTLSFTSPLTGTIDGDKVVNISMTANDVGSGLDYIKFYTGYFDNTSTYWHEIGTDTSSTGGWGLNWDGTAFINGTKIDFYAIAFDKAGNSVNSTIYNITLGQNLLNFVFLPLVSKQLPPAKIVFVTTIDGNKEIYTVNTDQTGLKRLTNNSSDDVDPNYSPDGTKIVFTSNRSGKRQIYTMLADGSQQIRLVTNSYDEGVPEWSPDGTKIAFTRYANFDGLGIRAEVFVMNSDGSNVVRLTTTSGITDTFLHGCWSSGWSPDSNKILYYCYVGYNQIWIMNKDGSNKQLIINETLWNSMPKMSPDGSKILFVSYRTNNYDVYTVKPDGTSLTRLTTDLTDEWAPSWSHDGKKILFEANRDGKTQVYWMSPDGTQQIRITNNTSYAGQPRWQP